MSIDSLAFTVAKTDLGRQRATRSGGSAETHAVLRRFPRLTQSGAVAVGHTAARLYRRGEETVSKGEH